MKIRHCVIISYCLAVSACSNNPNHTAPVTDLYAHSLSNATYVVKPTDTLYSIAWMYGKDYRDLAKNNHINYPYHLEVGQKIYLISTTPGSPSESVKKLQTHKETVSKLSHYKEQWLWPVKGVIVKNYSALNKGVDISGKKGGIIKSTSAGEVVYSGHGIRGYGNLIIIKHNEEFLSAYAHNAKLFVKEGQYVKSGQPIAEMGQLNGKGYILHFEIRQYGKPINPKSCLPV